jgi:hypothetical protein
MGGFMENAKTQSPSYKPNYEQSAVRLQEKRDNRAGLIGWLCVMTLASFGGLAMGYISTNWF